MVLIVPLWNWNFEVAPSPMTVQSSNCTFMELKFWNWALTDNGTEGSNCTFMELKCQLWVLGGWCSLVLIVPLWNWNRCLRCDCSRLSGSNCTFMELKLSMWPSAQREPYVLIVPLWNWNEESFVSAIKKGDCSNCTFMELKWWEKWKLFVYRWF